jgi:cyclohexadieny/prephenate dehydrogenase
MQLDTLAIVGVGLIGGSIGMAARQRGLARRVLGVGWRQSTLNLAQDLGAIHEGYLQLAPAVAAADLVVFCTPVQVIAAQVKEAAAHYRAGALLTDAGSTKSLIVSEVDGRLPSGVHFVGSHPLAGSEKRGPEYADPLLFQDRVTVITPTPTTDAEAADRVEQFWQALGAQVRRMSPEEHDRALALTSHAPHLLASALSGTLPADLFSLTATGFRDATRIAAGDPELWAGILLQNRQAIQEALSRTLTQIDRFRTAMQQGDNGELITLLEQGKKVRDALGD